VIRGDISVSSVVGEGSTFHLTIAALLPDNAEAEIAKNTSDAGQEEVAVKDNPAELGCRILLAEDGVDNQRLIAFLLRRAGAEVTIVDDGQKAVEMARSRDSAENAFDLVLMDMQMPVMDGYEAARELRAKGYRRAIVALTAHAMKEDRQKALDAGCDDYLGKPIDQRALLQLVSKYAASAACKEPQGCASLSREE
jgi:CheY-like chemotaxis protein